MDKEQLKKLAINGDKIYARYYDPKRVINPPARTSKIIAIEDDFIFLEWNIISSRGEMMKCAIHIDVLKKNHVVFLTEEELKHHDDLLRG